MNEKYQHLMKPNVGGILIQYRRYTSLSSAKNLCKVNIDIEVRAYNILDHAIEHTNRYESATLYAYLFHAWW